MTLTGAEISKALQGCESGEEIVLTVTGTVNDTGGLDVSSVDKSYADEKEAPEEKGPDMPHGVAIIVGGKVPHGR